MSLLAAALLTFRANIRRGLRRHDQSAFPFGTARELSPAEDSSDKAAIFSENAAARIRACPFGTNVDVEFRKLFGGRCGATIRMRRARQSG